MDESLWQPKKALSAMAVREEGRVMPVREVQDAKAPFPMVVILLGMVTDVKVPFLKRACPSSFTVKVCPSALI
ncbi:hypothetical protein Barb4_02623 [Bacteroidales bacterium Barb4]|nr:hypothetical protein Barb4_02623 [Bacteroidales bacterium Barb4]